MAVLQWLHLLLVMLLVVVVKVIGAIVTGFYRIFPFPQVLDWAYRCSGPTLLSPPWPTLVVC